MKHLITNYWPMAYAKGTDSSHKEHYTNARVYEKLRFEFATAISELMKQKQTGEKIHNLVNIGLLI